MTVGSRVCRGVALPMLLGGVPICLLVYSGLYSDRDRFYCVATAAVLAFLPAWAPGSRVYWGKGTHDFLAAHHDALTAHKLRPTWFLRAYRWHAAVAMLLPAPFVQVPYMANELHLFADGLHTQGTAQVDVGSGTERAPVSADGVRALAPVTFVLNLGTAALGVVCGGALLLVETKVSSSVSSKVSSVSSSGP